MKLKTELQSSSLRIFLFAFVLGSFQTVVHGIGSESPQYAIVFDAGSTGTRVLAYEFTSDQNKRLVLEREFFAKTQPGLSSYHAEPQQAAKSIENLLKKAKEFVPKELHASTPLVLKATAGLRLLGTTESENLLNAVRDAFVRSKFLIKDNSVEIMDGIDEGIYSWFAINMLTKRLLNQKPFAALDLGGGSTQVTFPIRNPTRTPLLADYLHEVTTSAETIDVFSTSYLNLGLQAVRYAVLTSGKTKDKIHYVNVCVHPKFKSEEFTYATKKYYITGKNNTNILSRKPSVDYTDCLKLVKKKVLPLVKPKPLTLKQNEVAAYSYFFGAAMETGLIPKSGGEITLNQFIVKAKEVCATAPNPAEPFMCMDLIYISVLLKNGYGLDKKTKIQLYRTVDGHQVTWALGCAYNLLDGMTRNKKDLDSESDTQTSTNCWKSLFKKRSANIFSK